MRNFIAKLRAAITRHPAGFVTRSQPSSGALTLRDRLMPLAALGQ
jgi:hypothetical protein